MRVTVHTHAATGPYGFQPNKPWLGPTTVRSGPRHRVVRHRSRLATRAIGYMSVMSEQPGPDESGRPQPGEDHPAEGGDPAEAEIGAKRARRHDETTAASAKTPVAGSSPSDSDSPPTTDDVARLTPDGHRLLGIYLDDHRAGANGGLSLARRLLRENPNNTLTATLSDVVGQIIEDTRTLDDIVQRVGHSPNRLKIAAAGAAEWIGRFKLGGRLRRYSPVSRLEEFEALCAGVLIKRSLWRTLGIVFDADPRLDGIDFTSLERRAEQQVVMLEKHHRQIVDLIMHAR